MDEVSTSVRCSQLSKLISAVRILVIGQAEQAQPRPQGFNTDLYEKLKALQRIQHEVDHMAQ